MRVAQSALLFFESKVSSFFFCKLGRVIEVKPSKATVSMYVRVAKAKTSLYLKLYRPRSVKRLPPGLVLPF